MDNVVQNINIEDIVPNNYQHQYDMKEIEELASSIKKHGLLEPITLRKKGNKYELILGNKRYKAAVIAGLETIPAIIKKMDDNQAKEYLMISNDTLVLNNISFSNSNEDNLDVINLSKLNEEYERDDFKMNNNQFDNNIQQPMNNVQNEPTFGGRFFPSLEDEPTNMSFGTPNTPTPSVAEQQSQSDNNFIDLTDLNIAPQNPQTPQMPQNNFVEPQPVNNMTQQSFNEPQPMNNTSSMANIENQQAQPSIPNGNIINLDSLKQNSEMGTQPIGEPVNIDNNFQNVINDFNPNNNMMPNQFEQSQMNEFSQMNKDMSPMQNVEPMMNLNNNFNQEIMTSSVEPAPINNIDFAGPSMTPPTAEPIMPNVGMEPVMNMNSQIQPEMHQPMTQKDVTPVINTLKALAVNLENFGYTIRITDEDLATSYKITIEVEK